MTHFNYRCFLFPMLFMLAACGGDDELDLPPVEERVSAAISELQNNLTAPTNGWKLEYTPTNESGVFFMILRFGADGKVNIQSDVADNNGEFLDHTIPYRIDNSLGIELILETFGVFHHLFEQDQASFGAEFEFIFIKKEGDNLIFESKSDFFFPTQLVFEPASANDASSFSTELATNLANFEGLSPQVFFREPTIQQVILSDLNISIFWSMDLSKRSLYADFAGVGTTADEITANGVVILDHPTGYSLRNGRLILQQPLNFQLGGQTINVNEVILNDYQLTGDRLCINGEDTNPRYNGGILNLSAVSMQNSLLSTAGNDFQSDVYTINAFFIFDGEGNSLTDEGGFLEQLFPTVSGFAFFFGVQLNDPNIPIYSVGLIMEDGALYLREYEPSTTNINKIDVTLNDSFYFDPAPPSGTEENLRILTDTMFEGGEVYAFEFPVDGIRVFRLFNACNGFEIFLVGS